MTPDRAGGQAEAVDRPASIGPRADPMEARSGRTVQQCEVQVDGSAGGQAGTVVGQATLVVHGPVPGHAVTRRSASYGYLGEGVEKLPLPDQ